MDVLLPHAPGVYLFKNHRGDVIYVGKAKDLQKRVSTYFHGTPVDSKTAKLVSVIESVDFIVVNNETEALILESNLIRKFKSKYNVDLKDSYRYPFVRLTAERFPRLEVVRAPKNRIEKSKRIWGPFVDGFARRRTLELLEKTFKLRTCRVLPKKACLKYYLGQCSAPCIGNISEEAYAQSVQKVEQFFSGKKEELLSVIESEMKDFAAKKQFELAIDRRNALFLLSGKPEKQLVDTFTQKDKDFLVGKKTVSGYAITLFPFRKGTLLGKNTTEFLTPLVSDDILEDFLLQYYANHRPPQRIITLNPLAHFDTLAETLSLNAGFPITVTDQPSAEEKKILELVEKNLDYSLNPSGNALQELRNALFLPALPVRIEAFDISHLGGKNTAASLVVLMNGKPFKSHYRHFRIRFDSPADDPAAMKEVIVRRYIGSLAKELPLPDLILVDGGKPQVSAAVSALNEINVKLPLIGLAKRNEEIFIPAKSEPIVLSKSSPALKLLQLIRDEAHRFANKYRKNMRGYTKN
ncbi:MAG: excinuclease ABC subunit UvrC [Candidatus Diapherotrites archaeon]|nr:excinuclease ABC subunit UvrC [Candidatus Diapherotrites archaeon]